MSGSRWAYLLGLSFFTLLASIGSTWADVATLYGRTLKCSSPTESIEFYVSEKGVFRYDFDKADSGIRFEFARQRHDVVDADISYTSKARLKANEIELEYDLVEKNSPFAGDAPACLQWDKSGVCIRRDKLDLSVRGTRHLTGRGRIALVNNEWRFESTVESPPAPPFSSTMLCEVIKGHAVSNVRACFKADLSMADMRACFARERLKQDARLDKRACSQKSCVYRLSLEKAVTNRDGYEIREFGGGGYRFIEDASFQSGSELLPIGAKLIDPQGRLTIVGNSGGTCCDGLYEYVSGPLHGASLQRTMLRGKEGYLLTVPR